MDGWGDAEARTWLAMDLLAPVHDLWDLEVVPGPGGEAPPAVQALTEGLLGEHRPELTEAALAGLLDLERALVVGAALEIAGGLVEPDVLVLVECALVDEACRLALLPLVNAAADLLLELEREAAQGGEASGAAVPGDDFPDADADADADVGTGVDAPAGRTAAAGSGGEGAARRTRSAARHGGPRGVAALRRRLGSAVAGRPTPPYPVPRSGSRTGHGARPRGPPPRRGRS